MNNKKKSDTEEGEVATFHVCVCVRRLFVFNLHGLNGEGGASVCASLCRSASPLRRQMARRACQRVGGRPGVNLCSVASFSLVHAMISSIDGLNNESIHFSDICFGLNSINDYFLIGVILPPPLPPVTSQLKLTRK